MEELNKLLIKFRNLKTKKTRNTTYKRASYEKCQRALQKLF